MVAFNYCNVKEIPFSIDKFLIFGQKKCNHNFERAKTITLFGEWNM